ncbi:MAG: hypothetical protein IJE66_02490 [Akkermansia sp.]|nr:hypothetical protein [Akkermansia sp.]
MRFRPVAGPDFARAQRGFHLRRQTQISLRNYHKERNPFLPEWAKLLRKRRSEIDTAVSAKSTALCAVGDISTSSCG